MIADRVFDAVVVGGGPAGATAATDLARQGRAVLLLDRSARKMLCGAIPPRLIEEFAVPESLLVARVTMARMISPSARQVDMPIEGGFVGLVNREIFDQWLRQRATAAGAECCCGSFERLTRDADGTAIVHYRPGGGGRERPSVSVRARAVIGADGALSAVARQTIPSADRLRHVLAYHEIVRSPVDGRDGFDPARCDVYYQGAVSPDFYGWVFPHGETTSIGAGTAQRGFSLRRAVAQLRQTAGLADSETLRCEAAPIPFGPLPRWDNGRDVVLAGDAAGMAAPASGEGIYYAMVGGRMAAQAVDQFCTTGEPRALTLPRKRFMKAHGQIFWVLSMMRRFWYINDRRRERFVSLCRDEDIQRLTFEAYMSKEVAKPRLLTHMSVFCRNLTLDTLSHEVITRPRLSQPDR
jgi:geranylgeranyl reductase